MKYRTIVADPPWDVSNGMGSHAGRSGTGANLATGAVSPMAYSLMSLAEIKALPVTGLAEDDAHLYLWTTQGYLRDAYDVAAAWGFTPSCALVWCKPVRGWTVGGTYMSTTEFCLFCRRGSLKALRRVESQWFEWNRGQHSAKPEAFLDMVESVSPAPRAELFARRQRIGWDTWGNEALEHVSLSTSGASRPVPENEAEEAPCQLHSSERHPSTTIAMSTRPTAPANPVGRGA